MNRTDVWNGKTVEFLDGSINFRAKRSLTIESVSDLFGERQVLELRELIPAIHLFSAKVDITSASTIEIAEDLNRHPDVLWAEPTFIAYPAGHGAGAVAPTYPNDPDLDKQWNMQKVGAAIAWGYPSRGGTGDVMIAILDSGIQLDAKGHLSHPDLMSDRIVLEENCLNPGGTLNDLCGHGTHVAGISGATTNNAVGVAGMNWNSPLHIYKVFELNAGTGKCEGTDAAVAIGINSALSHALAHKINVVVNYSGSGPCSMTYKDACQYVDTYNTTNVGVSQALFCAAAGNEGISPASCPGNYSIDYPATVVCVGSSDPDDTRSSFSNFGDGLTVLAPGSNILSTTIGSSYGAMDGTSMATPLVSGIISLIWSQRPSSTSQQVVETLKNFAVKLQAGVDHDPNWGWGRVTSLWDDSYFTTILTIEQGTPSSDTYEVVLEIMPISN